MALRVYQHRRLPLAALLLVGIVVVGANAQHVRPSNAKGTDHWCWQEVQRPNLPDGNGEPIDRFIYHQLRLADLTPAPRSDLRTLVRRLKLDLIGLPPTTIEIEEALSAGDDEATYQQLVDKWLASPRFGEKWATVWLDVVRYAETKGHVSDNERPYAWKYRDYVIDALNDDLPYDRFLVEHLAGDLLPDSQHRPGRGGQTNVTPTATGALFMHEMHFMAVDPVKQRWDEIDAQIDTVGQAFLGLTLGCARCHDHKFDAISQQDYYALAGFFYSTEQGKARTAPRHVSRSEQTKQLEVDYRSFLDAQIENRREAQSPKAMGYFPISEELGIQAPATYKKLVSKMKSLEAADPSWSHWVRAATDVVGTDVRLLVRGNHRNTGETQPRRFLSAIHASNAPTSNDLGPGSGRMWLARQIANAHNPLTSRVWANRLWHHLFGRGIVSTPNNFGVLGGLPSHPKLLDYLAKRLVESNWSTKSLVREIVLSDAYRRSSASSPAAKLSDPQNILLSHQNRRRLTGEAIRDSMLMISGRLDSTMYGEGVPIYVPPYATSVKPGHIPSSGPLDGAGRRSVYLKVRRSFQEPLLQTFDFPDRGKSVGKRPITVVPSQSLALLNGPFVHQQATTWGKSVAKLSMPISQRLAFMFEQVTGRPPENADIRTLTTLTHELAAAYAVGNEDQDRMWPDIAHVLLNLDDLIVIP